jgi:transcriptional regulator with PAS, ATPase and Fis domain
MIESIKNKIWAMLKQKEISLAMVYNKDGRILWHRGRKIKGKNIHEGERFSKTHILKTIKSGKPIKKENVVITSSGNDLPHSAKLLPIKSLIIYPLGHDLFLYLDSGIKDFFDPVDFEVFKVIGELLKETIDQIKEKESHTGGITGRSEAIEKIRELVLCYALEEEPVLLLGETGVGKNHIAELIHRFSGRKGPFVLVHTPTIPETLFESEIFGHKKWSFSDAKKDKKGLVAEAEGGTLFFDEIADVPVTFQAKLLQFLDTRRYRILGDTKDKKADVRIIAATNQNLEEEMKAKQFRKDLYYRLNILPIRIPPLRERKDDIRAIVKENEMYLKGKSIGKGFWEVLFDYNWPGNIRELLTVIKRAGIQLPGPGIGKEITDIIHFGNADLKPVIASEIQEIKRLIKSGKSFWDSAWKNFLKRNLSRQDIKELLKDFYLENQQNLKKMSRDLHISEQEYPRFIAALHKYNIHPSKKITKE